MGLGRLPSLLITLIAGCSRAYGLPSILTRAHAELLRLSDSHPSINSLDLSSREAIVTAMAGVFLDLSSAPDHSLVKDSGAPPALALDAHTSLAQAATRSVISSGARSSGLLTGAAVTSEIATHSASSASQSQADVAFEATMAAAEAKRAPLADVRFSSQQQQVLAASTTLVDLANARAASRLRQRVRAAHALVDVAFSEVAQRVNNEPHSAAGGSTFDASTGLAEPTAECKRVLNTWLAKCVFGPPPAAPA
jgi:hypothetical protein